MFQFPGFPACDYFIHHTLPDSSSGGLPHSDIRGSTLIYSSPQLFAVSHVLLRLPVPRHSPYALLRLNFFRFSRSLDLLRSIRISFQRLFFNLAFLQNCRFTLFTEKPFLFWFPCFCYVSRFFSLFGFQRSSPASLPRRCQHRPIFPGSLPLSIVGTEQLNFRVRYGYGWTLFV